MVSPLTVVAFQMMRFKNLLIIYQHCEFPDYQSLMKCVYGRSDAASKAS
jgi:hypothetical protein